MLFFKAEVSHSSIAIAGKFESLNLTQSCNSNTECTESNSDLDFFKIDSPDADDSYLNLFKSPEDLLFENIVKKPNLKGLINVVCVEDQTDNESENFDNLKVIDFVPLDDDVTLPVFDSSCASSNVLENSTDSETISETAANVDSMKSRSFEAAKKIFDGQ